MYIIFHMLNIESYKKEKPVFKLALMQCRQWCSATPTVPYDAWATPFAAALDSQIF